ncbi:hypothetical protein ADK38_16815, partial [Streptomyces varsoviensis]
SEADELDSLLRELPFADRSDLDSADSGLGDLPKVPGGAEEFGPKAPEAVPGAATTMDKRVGQALKHLGEQARRHGMDPDERRELTRKITEDSAAGKYREAAEGLRELQDKVAVAGLGERLQHFRRHLDGGYDRVSGLGMRRSEWYRRALDIESSAQHGTPHETTELLRQYDDRLGELRDEVAARGDASSLDDELRAARWLSDSRRAREEALGMTPERGAEWASRCDTAASAEDELKILSEYEAELAALDIARRLGDLEKLGASERELGEWGRRFEQHGLRDDIKEQYDRRVRHLREDAETADLRRRLEELKAGGPDAEGFDDFDGPVGSGKDAEPNTKATAEEPGGAADEPGKKAASEHDEWEARERRWVAEREEALGMPPKERRRWAERRAGARTGEERDHVDIEHLERLRDLSREREVRQIRDGDPDGPARTEEQRKAWNRRFEAAARNPEATDLLLEEYRRHSADLRDAELARLDDALTAPDPLNPLNRRIDQELDALPASAKAAAARDSATLLERLGRLGLDGDG